nr:ribonuclease H-like domain-containing protein [Tanacetum cinerariifolium]
MLFELVSILVDRIISSLHQEFDMTDLGPFNYFLGLSVICDSTGLLSEELYASPTGSLVAYSDADWDGFPSTRRSTSGYCVFLEDKLLSWSSKRQYTISRSSAEAEYRGVSNVAAETVWIRNHLRELHSSLFSVTLVYCDNVSAIYLTANPVQHQRTKHIEIDIHLVRDMVTRGQVRVLHVPSHEEEVSSDLAFFCSHPYASIVHTECGDGVASTKRRRRDLSSDSVRKLMTASGRNLLKSDLEGSIS